MSLRESLTGGDVASDATEYQDMGGSHGPRGGKSSASSSSFVDAIWGSNARKVVTVATALIITVLLGIAVYALTHQAEEPPGVVPPVDGGSTGSAYIPAETDMLRRLANEMDTSRDMSADPCNDWYQYACGGWVASTQLQPNQTMNTKGFTEARDDNQRYIREILEADWPIITPMYQSCMDVDSIHRAGLEPVRYIMWALAPNSSVINSKADYFGALGELRHDMRLTALVSAAQTSNQSNPRQPMLQLGFGGFSIAGQNAWMSYLGPNASRTTSRLVDGITAMFQLFDGDDQPRLDSRYYAEKVVEFETALINITSRAAIAQYYRPANLTLQQRLDEMVRAEHALGAENGMYSFDELYELAPNLHMGAYFNGSSLIRILRDSKTPMVAYVPDNASLPLVDALVASTPLDVLLAYARWRALNVSMPYLSYEVRALHHSYFGEFEPVNSYEQLGLGALPNNYQYCSALVVNNMDDLFGRYFMSLRLQPEKADVARNLITWIRQAFERNLPSISWMDERTRAVALDKANAVLELVGGPRDGVWADYSLLTIRRDAFYYNWLQVQQMRAEDEWQQLTKPISRAKFTMNPSLVNAQYSSRANAMTFPAAILQQPFFDFDYPMAVNLGRIGMVMGHELLHGFDNNGRQFDKDGVRRQWWDDSVVWAFGNKSQCLIDQYDNIRVQGTNISGRFTLGENIADNGGLHMAYLALQYYKDMLAANGTVDPTPPSKHPLTTDQLFYWANAQTWCTKATDAAIANQVRTDVHSPGEARVWGPIVNQPADQFAKAFNCPVGSRMNPKPEDKCDLY